LGKYYPFPYSQSDPESVTVFFANCVGNTVSFTVADVRISRFQPRRNGTDWFGARAGEFTRGVAKSS
jgi:hypothetical protein